MEKEFVPYELAVRLKELGFNGPCFGFYDNVDKAFYQIHSASLIEDEAVYIITKAPLYQQVFSWFRENHRMFHEIFIDTEPTIEEPDKLEFAYLILHMIGSEYMHTSKNKRFDTYEEAEFACLGKLIEIVESKSE